MATMSRSDHDLVREPTAIAVAGDSRRRVSWGAIIGGVAIALAVQMLLSMLGLGLGLTTIEPNTGGTPDATSIGIGAVAWWVISALLALLAGGYVASRLAGTTNKRDGMLHGLLTWASMLIISVWLLTSVVGSVLGGAFNMLGGAVSSASQAVSNVAPQVADAAGLSTDQIQQQVDNLLRANNAPANPESARQELVSLMGQVATGQQTMDQVRPRAVEIISQQAGITPQEAEARIQEFQTRAEQFRADAEATARETTEATASALSSGALWTCLALALSAIAAAIGGSIGTRRETHDYPTTGRY
jgi:hypothetical protein